MTELVTRGGIRPVEVTASPACRRNALVIRRKGSVMARLECVQPVLMSRDVSASIRYFVDRLGFTLGFVDDPADPRFAGVKRDGVVLLLQWHAAAEWDHPYDRPTYRFVVQDVDALFQEFRQSLGLSPTSAVIDTTWGTREFHVRDPDGNGLQFYSRRTAGT